MLYHDSPEKQEKLKAFTMLTKQTPNNIEHLYDILISINGQKHNMNIQYVQRLADMDKMYEYAKKKL